MGYTSAFIEKACGNVLMEDSSYHYVPPTDLHSGFRYSKFITIEVPEAVDEIIKIKVPSCCTFEIKRELNNLIGRPFNIDRFIVGIHQSETLYTADTTDKFLRYMLTGNYGAGAMLNKCKLKNTDLEFLIAPGLIMHDDNVILCNYVTYNIIIDDDNNMVGFTSSDAVISLDPIVLTNPSNFIYKAIIKKIVPCIHSEFPTTRNWAVYRSRQNHRYQGTDVVTRIGPNLLNISSVNTPDVSIDQEEISSSVIRLFSDREIPE